jgi:hypothetical protein
MLLEPGPGLGFRPFEFTVEFAGKVLARANVNGVTWVAVPVPVEAGSLVALTFTADQQGKPVCSDPRTLSFRVFAIGQGRSSQGAESRPGTWAALAPSSRPPKVDWAVALERWRPQIVEMGKQEYIHMNACGDFTLMAREHWFDLRGYPELDLFSMHLDSILCWAAHVSGAREEVFPEPMRIYHIEHGVGSGWTPEGEDQLFARIARKGIQAITHEELVEAIVEMRLRKSPIIFNGENWGLSDQRLRETTPVPASEISLKEVTL